MLDFFDEIQMPQRQKLSLSKVSAPISVFPQPLSADNSTTMTGPSSSGEAYYTRDLLTDPPTVVHIVGTLPPGSGGCGGHRQGGGPPTFAVTFADIEPTAGWLSDRNNASLDVCFMHSFGKCSGKAKERDPRTCHQIHVKKDVLDRLRRSYVNPQRNYFCRTMKANITEKFAQVLSLLARRRFALQYLEFKTEDIDVTSGSTAYEVQYRHWLVSDNQAAKAGEDRRTAGANTDNFISASDLCWDFALTGRCPKGATCQALHGHVAKALTKDRFVRLALEEMGRKEGSDCHNKANPLLTFSVGVNQHQQQHQQHQPHQRHHPHHFATLPQPPPLSHPAVQQQQHQHQQQQQQQQQHQQQQQQSFSPQPYDQQKRHACGGDSSQVQMGRTPHQPSPTETLPFHLPPPQSLGPSFIFPGTFGHIYGQQHQSNILGSLPPPPQLRSAVSPPTASATSVSTNGAPTAPSMPFFAVSEGTNNVLRLIPMNGFSPYNGLIMQ